jgi:hypothetical protein
MHQLRAWSLALHCVLCYHQHKQVQAIKNEVVRLKVDGYTMASERVCGECSLCCKIIAVDVLQKPAGVWCGHCLKTSGCSIYGRRPDECRQFNCGWLVNPEFGDEWYPRRSKMVLTFDRRANRVGVHVDAGSPAAWRREPYFAQLKQWARDGVEQRLQVVVYIVDKIIVILPDKEVDLGVLGPDEQIIVSATRTASGWTFDAYAEPRSE